MATEVDLQLDKFGIDMNRYRELKYFCRQYPKKKERLHKLQQAEDFRQRTRGMEEPMFFVSDPVARRNEEISALSRDVDLIEQVAYEVDPYDWRELLRHVSEGTPVQQLSLTQCWRKFYETRRRFYWVLSQRR